MKKINLLLSLLLFTFLLSVSVIIHLAHNLLDNDTSGELVLSHCLYENKSPICEDWTYGTEFRINNQIIFGCLFLIFNNWITVRIAGTIIIEVLMLFSFVIMMRSINIKTESILFGSILLLLPYCVAYGRIVLYYSFYAPYITFMFLIFACYFKVINGNSRWHLLAFLIAFTGCANGIRQFFTTIIPLVILHFLLWLKKRSFRFLAKISSVFFGGISGLIFFYLFLMKVVHLEQGAGIIIKYKGISEIFTVLFSIMRQFGYRSGISRSSFLGIMSIGGIFVMIYAIIISIKKIVTEKSVIAAIIYGMLPLTLLLNAITFIFFDLPYNQRYDYARYLTPASVWCIPLFTMISDTEVDRKKVFLFRIIIAVFITNSLMNYCFFQDSSLFSQEYDGLPFKNTSDIGRYKNSMDYLKNNDFSLGYTFSDANVLIEKLNGCPVIPIEEKDGFLVYIDLLTRKSFRDLKAENVFFLANYNDASSFLSYPVSQYADLVYNDQNELFIFRITNPVEFKQELDTHYKK